MSQQSVVYNKKDKRYHLVKVDANDKIIFDYGPFGDNNASKAIDNPNDYILDSDVGGGGTIDPVNNGNVRFGVELGSQLEFDLDPDNLREITYIKAAVFTGSGGYLQSAASSDWDFSGSNGKFSVVYWRTPDELVGTSSLTGLDQAYVANYSFGTSGACSFCIESGGSTNQANSIRLWLATNSGGSNYEIAYTDAKNTSFFTGGTPYSMGAVTYDGSQGTATNRPKFYMDGLVSGSVSYINQSGTTTGAGLPAAPLAAASGTMKIGNFGGSVTHIPKQAIHHVLIYKGVTLSQAQITALYNDGVPLSYAEMCKITSVDLITGLVACWELDEESGTRV